VFFSRQIRAKAVEFWSDEASGMELSQYLAVLLRDHHLDPQSGGPTAIRFAPAVEASWLAASSVLLLKLADTHERFEAGNPLFRTPTVNSQRTFSCRHSMPNTHARPVMNLFGFRIYEVIFIA
jgi:hypothetical protein